MTLKRSLNQFATALVLAICCLASDVSAQSSKILTVYCPGTADVRINDSPTYTRGPVRQYVINYPAHDSLRIDMTGMVGKEMKSVSRIVALSSQTNYIARFHPVPASQEAEAKMQKADATTPKCDDKCAEKCCSLRPALRAQKSNELLRAEGDLGEQEDKLEGLQRELKGLQKKVADVQGKLDLHKGKTPPVKVAATSAQVAMNAAQSRLTAVRKSYSAVIANIKKHEVHEVSLQQKIKLLTRDTIVSRTAKAELINYQSALAGLRLEQSQLKVEVEEKEKLAADAATSYQTIIRNNEDVDKNVYGLEMRALTTDLTNAKAAVSPIKQQIAVQDLVRLRLVDKVFQLQRKEKVVQPEAPRLKSPTFNLPAQSGTE